MSVGRLSIIGVALVALVAAVIWWRSGSKTPANNARPTKHDDVAKTSPHDQRIARLRKLAKKYHRDKPPTRPSGTADDGDKGEAPMDGKTDRNSAEYKRARKMTKLPKPLFDLKAGFERIAPLKPARARAAKVFGEVPDEVWNKLETSFNKANDYADLSIGFYRLGKISIEEAQADIGAHIRKWRKATMKELGISETDFDKVFGEYGK